MSGRSRELRSTAAEAARFFIFGVNLAMSEPDILTFDLESWIHRVPLSEERARIESRCRVRFDPEMMSSSLEEYLAMNMPGGDFIVGPSSLALREQLLREAARTRDLGRAVATDVFVWATGEAPRRDTTKYGGLPYWPARRAWPLDHNGKLHRFVAQLRICESRDLFSDAPNDLLLLFASPDALENGLLESRDIHLEWSSIEPSGRDHQLIDELPYEPTLRPCWGQRARIHDYPDASDRLSQFKLPEQIAIIEGTKIGGIPPAIQPHDPVDARTYRAAFGSINGSPLTHWPFLDIEWRQARLRRSEEVGWMWGDMGSALVIAQRDGFGLKVDFY